MVRLNLHVREKDTYKAALRTDELKVTYVNEKVEEWCKEIKNLSTFSKTQTDAAFSAYMYR